MTPHFCSVTFVFSVLNLSGKLSFENPARGRYFLRLWGNPVFLLDDFRGQRDDSLGNRQA